MNKFQIAIYGNELDSLELILESITDEEKLNMYNNKYAYFLCIETAVEHNYCLIIRTLLQNGILLSKFDIKDGYHCLRDAIISDRTEIVRLLIRYDYRGIFQKNTEGVRNIDSYLIYATENNNLEIVKLLLDHGCDPASDCRESICIAAKNNYLDVLFLLVEFLEKKANK